MGSNVITIYKVTLPSFIVWPGKVSVHIAYTEFAAQQFIDDYPNRWLVPYMKIEPEEIIAYETD